MDKVSIIIPDRTGWLFHYAHFMCDCLLPEVVNKVYNYKNVYRQKIISQTLGNFVNIYEDVMQNKSHELNKSEYEALELTPITMPSRYKHGNRKDIGTFRRFIFNRYNIDHLNYESNYPEILLIKRAAGRELISDQDLQKQVPAGIATTGSQRREMADPDLVEEFMQERFGHNLKTLYLEDQSFLEQIKLFNNAKFIVMAHGAGMSNLLFCKKGATILEVRCNTSWNFFDTITKAIGLKHRYVNENNLEAIKSKINESYPITTTLTVLEDTNKKQESRQQLIKVRPSLISDILPIRNKCTRKACPMLEHSNKANNNKGYCCRACLIGKPTHGWACEKMKTNRIVKNNRNKCTRPTCSNLEHSSNRNNGKGFCCKACLSGKSFHGIRCEKKKY